MVLLAVFTRYGVQTLLVGFDDRFDVGHVIGAELAHIGIGYGKRDLPLGDHRACRNGAYVASLLGGLGHLERVKVHGLQRLHERGNGLHGRRDHQGHARGHAALKAAGVVGRSRELGFRPIEQNGVVHLRTGLASRLEAHAELHAFDGGDAEQGAADGGRQALGGHGIAADARQKTAHDHAERASQAVFILDSPIDLAFHGLAGLRIRAADFARLDLKRRVARRVHERIVLAHDGASNAGDVGEDLHAQIGQKLARDARRRNARRGGAGA